MLVGWIIFASALIELPARSLFKVLLASLRASLSTGSNIFRFDTKAIAQFILAQALSSLGRRIGGQETSKHVGPHLTHI